MVSVIINHGKFLINISGRLNKATLKLIIKDFNNMKSLYHIF